MAWKNTTAYYKIRAMDGRINVVQGGTSAGKTYDIVGMLADLSFDYAGEVISLCTDTFPNLKRGAMRDLRAFLAEMNWSHLFQENKSDHTFENLSNHAILEFFSTDEAGALGARRSFLFVNEANRISEETFTQLEIRTKRKVWLDFNPVNKFWAHDLITRPDTQFIKLNYQDNEALDEATIRTLELRKGDGKSNWWRVYGEGEIGSLEGNVYEGWIPEDEIPSDIPLKRYGVDFGYKDPTTIVAVHEDENGELWLKLHLCQSELTTPRFIEICKTLPEGLFVCDNARPEIIAEMQANGLRAIGSDKTAGEKMNGKRYNIDLVQRRKVHYMRSDKELEQEYLTYAWRKKKDGRIIDEPEDGNDHVMDAIAYAVRDMERKPIVYGGLR